MSVLETPRILFRGKISWDPITTNNYDTFYNEVTDEPVYPDETDRVKAFRQAAIDAVGSMGNWNPDGTHRAVFYGAAVSGVDLGEGPQTGDPFVASPANFMGMLVDLEPYGSISSQLYFDKMHFGIDGGYRINCKRNSRFTARYINFARNPANNMIAGVASVVWQTSFAKGDGLTIDAFDSPALRALQSALAADDVAGLTVRFNAYRTIYYDNPALSNGSPGSQAEAAKLIAKLNGGGFQPNPARSVMVGVIGLWRRDEPVHEPGDRALLPPMNSPLGGAFARLGDDRLTIDLANSTPESSRDLVKRDFGPLTVTAGSTVLGRLAYDRYDRAAYDAGSGIVTLALSHAQAHAAAKGDIQVKDAGGQVLLSEVALRAIPETPNVYLDELSNGTQKDPSARLNATASFRVYDRGKPAREQLPVTVYTMSADGTTVGETADLKTDADGRLSFAIAAGAAGISAYVPSLRDAAPPGSDGSLQFNSFPAYQGINTQYNTYMYIRTLEADDDIGTLPPTWDNVYVKVLANWNAMAPCMDNWLMLDSPEQVMAHAQMLKAVTAPQNFENFIFMPVTRDMTVGERKLLYAFLDAGGGPKALSAAAEPQRRDFAKLSRSMRRP